MKTSGTIFMVCECEDLENPFIFAANQFMSLGKIAQLLRAAEIHIRQCEKCCKKYGDPMLLREIMLKKRGEEDKK